MDSVVKTNIELEKEIENKDRIIANYRLEVIRRNMIIEKLVKTGKMLMDGDKDEQDKEWENFKRDYNL